MANGFQPDVTPPGTAPMPLGKPAPPPAKRATMRPPPKRDAAKKPAKATRRAFGKKGRR